MIDKTVASGIIEPAALNELLGSETAANIKIIDGTFVLPGSEENPLSSYKEARIGNAVFFDINEIANHSTDLPHMLPSPEEFEASVSGLGISNDDLVVVYGQAGMLMGPARVWWSFRAFGHDKVCVLNGGLPAWLAEGFALNEEPPQSPTPAQLKAEFRPELVRDIKQVGKISDTGTIPILDARPAGRFDGTTPEPRAGMRSGHMPGSYSVPCGTLITDDTGKLKSREELQLLFEDVGIQIAGPIVTTCGSGVTACVISLALYHLGNKNAAVYDGSWSEWGKPGLETTVITT